MAESISPERMQRLMELSNNAMTVELGALRNPQVTTVPSSINPNEAFYQIVPERDRVLNKLLREQYRNLESAQDRLTKYPDEADRLQKEIDTAQQKINEINSYPEEVVSNYIKKLQTEKINTLKDTVYRDFNPDFSLSNLDQTRDQIFLSEGQNESVLAHELGHGAFKEAQNFFFQKMKELGSIEAAEKAVALEYGETLARVISNENFGQGIFPNLDEGTVQYYDNPLGDDPNNPGVGEPVSLDGKTYYQSGFEGIYDGNVRTDPLLQKPFTDYRTGELVYHDEYKGDFEADLKKAGLMGFETLMSDLISERKGLDRFAERQRRGLKINPLGAPPSVAHETIRDKYGKILFNKGAETGGTQVLRSVRPQLRPKNFAQGGPVMRGIGTLNETARNMFRGPRGIGAYQQFADGGPAQNDLNRLNTLFENAPSNNFTLTEAPFVFMPNESELSALERERLESTYGGDNRYVFEQKKLPVSGTIQYQKNRDGSKRFDAEIEKKFKGELGSITPSARYSTQRSSKRSGNIIVDETGRQVGFAVEGEIYIDPDSENKLKGAIDVENSKKSRSFTIPEGQILKTEDGTLLKKFNLGVDLGSLGLDATYFDDSTRGTRAEGSATIKIGDNGIIKYNDSSDGSPVFSAKYAADLGDGTANLNYENDLRNVPRYGAELNTKFGEGVGSLSYRNDGRGNTFGAKYNITFASGGEVSGPPPTRGPDPQGIGAYQQFAGGGEANRELKEIPPARGLPPMDRPFGDSIRNFEDTFSKPQGRGKGYFDDVNFRIDSFEFDGKPSYAIEFDDGFSMIEPQIIEMMDENNSANEPIPGERTRKELFRYLFEKNPTSEEFFRYLKTTGLASGGEVSGPDPQGIGAFQQFADGGPVYMSNGGEGSVERIKDGVLQTVFDVESNGDFNRWHDNAQNIPETPLTQMTVSEIMGYQGGENGPAAGAGQIKYNTFQYLLNTGTLKPDEVFSPQVQRKAHFRLLDRRGFNEWVQGELSNDGFIQRLAREYAAVPLAQDEQVGDTLRESGKSRYGGSNAHRISLDNMRNVLTSLKSPSMASEAALDEAMYAADYLEPQTMPLFAEPEEAGPDLIDAQTFDSGVGSMMSPTTGEELRQGFRPRFGSPAQEDDYMSMVPQKISMRDKYSTENIAADLVGGKEALEEGIGGLTESLRPNLRPSEIEFGEDKGGVFRSLMPKYRPLKRYPGSNPEGLFRGFQDLDLLLRKGVEQPATDIRGEPA